MIAQIALTLVMLCLISFGISTLMEIYKKKIRKDKASVWEIRAVSLGLSAVATLLVVVTGLFQPIITLVFPSATVWLDYILYCVIIWVLQLQEDLKILKMLMRLSASKAVDADFKKLVESFKAKTGVDAADVAVVLAALGYGEDKAREILKELSVSDEDVEAIITKLKEALKK